MVNKEEISAIKAELNALKEQSYELDSQYRVKSQELLEKVLSCKDVINETKWKLRDDRTLVSLNTKHKMIADFLQGDHHCHFSTDELALNFDDWDITIFFQTSEGLVKFVERNGVTLDVSSLKKQLEKDRSGIKKLEAEIKKIEELNHVAM